VTRSLLPALVATVALASACARRSAEERPAPPAPVPSPLPSVAAEPHEHGHDAPPAPPEANDARPIAADGAFADGQPVPLVHVRYAITLPDERALLPTERALHLDDSGERASLQLVGTGLPMVPGTRVAARAGLTGFALLSPEGQRYRAISPDELQQWFLGHGSRVGSTVSFRRSGDILVATRGGLSLALATERGGEAHPLGCRMLVALFLGGDPSAARAGCASAAIPVRATLRARGWPAIVLERTARTEEQRPRASLAVPPAEATPDLPLPQRAAHGGFFVRSELAALGGAQREEHTLTITNGLSREALVFVDDVAIGWIAAGHTAAFSGLTDGRHAVRARALDGLERSRTVNTAFPATVTLLNAPLLGQ
jgi:hypothetical protein